MTNTKNLVICSDFTAGGSRPLEALDLTSHDRHVTVLTPTPYSRYLPGPVKC